LKSESYIPYSMASLENQITISKYCDIAYFEIVSYFFVKVPSFTNHK